MTAELKIEYNLSGLAYKTKEGGTGVVSGYRNAQDSVMTVVCTETTTGHFVVVISNADGSNKSVCTIPLKEMWQVNDLLQDFAPVRQFI